MCGGNSVYIKLFAAYNKLIRLRNYSTSLARPEKQGIHIIFGHTKSPFNGYDRIMRIHVKPRNCMHDTKALVAEKSESTVTCVRNPPDILVLCSLAAGQSRSADDDINSCLARYLHNKIIRFFSFILGMYCTTWIASVLDKETCTVT